VSGSGRCYNRRSLRGLHRKSTRTQPEIRADRRGGQPRCSQGREGKGPARRTGLLVTLPATIFAGLESHRESFLDGIKGALRKAQARTREALIEALGVAISAVTPRDMLVASSNMADTIYPSSFYETGCRSIHWANHCRMALAFLSAPLRRAGYILVNTALGAPA
jgi:hypothetical protein